MGRGERRTANDERAERASGPASARRRRRDGGFTLLEVMIALLILAMGLTAISYANSVAVSQVARVTRMTTASFLLEGVVNDIHANYVRKGFPSNSLEGRECELPPDFQKDFRCRYDLKVMNLQPDQVSSVIQMGVEAFTTGASAAQESLGGGTGSGSGPTAEKKTPQPGAPAAPDLTQLALLAPLFGPEGQEFISLCNVNLAQLMIGITSISTYMPQIIDQISKRTRQLTVRMSWPDGPRNQRELVVQTFVVSLPEEEVQAMKQQEQARENAQAIDDYVKSTDPRNRNQDKNQDRNKDKRTK
jgi:prepilin-type N-terminal cleavage/methylation domain-containing protein